MEFKLSRKKQNATVKTVSKNVREVIERILMYLESNIKVRGNAKSEDYDLPETFVAFSRVVAG